MFASSKFSRSSRWPGASRVSGASLLVALLLSGCVSVSLDEPMRPMPGQPYPRQPYPPTPPAVPQPQWQPPPPAQVEVTPVVPNNEVQPVRQPGRAAFTTRLDGRNVVPPAYSMGTGTLDAVLDRETGVFRFILNYANVGGRVISVQFHGPADVGGNAPAVATLGGPINSPFEGRLQLTPAQSADLLAGRWYVDVRTERGPDGELRGQLIEQR